MRSFMSKKENALKMLKDTLAREDF